MPKTNSSKNLSTGSLSGNLLYRRSGLHLDGLRRAQGSHAHYYAYKPSNPRWGLDYVVTTIGQSWEIVTEDKNFNKGAGFPPSPKGLGFHPVTR